MTVALAPVALVAVVRACQGCGACLLTCPARALRPDGGRLVVLPSCDGCGECVEVCPVDAIDLVPRGTRCGLGHRFGGDA